MKYIFVSGGVISGLGKGVTTAALAFLLKSRGYKVTTIKIDMYFNVDAGTLRPQEHGEVFVTHDGMETDEDLGHYERFLHENLYRQNYVTAGQIYQEIIRKERALEYDGATVDVIPHVTDEIIKRINLAGEKHGAEIVIAEFGGTVGEYKNAIFFEASRILKFKHPKDVLHVHVTYLPFLPHIGELKSKPAQASVHILNGMGIQPDVIIARSEKTIDAKRLEKLALFCNIPESHIFSAPNMDTIYKIPLIFHEQGHHMASLCLKLLGLSPKKHKDLKVWKDMINSSLKNNKKELRIGIIGKYFATGDYKLADSYVSVVEALLHASWKLGVKLNLSWIDSEKDEKNMGKIIPGFNGIVVPQGWGRRGVEGKIQAIKIARENKIPYLGLCFGMQMASIEFARNVLGLKDANTQEVNPDTKNPVIHIMPDQEKYLSKNQYGGTIRLGAWPSLLKRGTKIYESYRKHTKSASSPWLFDRGGKKTSRDNLVYERHRHRYEFNNKYKKLFESKGFVISATSPDGKLIEAIELTDHPFFVGTQFHPEYISRPLTPHPLFVSYLSSMI